MHDGRKPELAVDEPWRNPQATPYISIRNVTKRVGDFVAVNDVSLNLAPHAGGL